ncbi:hypothetical protein [Actinoplanes sp. CA-252034]|uniref:hypothetical protein n=1 Tax=Actinoplanes sp. CA-252034 TaxID=3239906 RepID=UPI003D969DDB
MISDWLHDQTATFLAMRDQTVASWHGVEMAVRGGDEGTPEYNGPDVPCLQLLALDAVRPDGTAVNITTYQNDLSFGMWANAGAVCDRDDRGRGYRRRALTELPTGRIVEVEVYLDDDVLAEVRIQIADNELLLVAGESYEDWSGGLEWHRLDESVLVFTDPGEAEKMRWVPSRGALRRIG